MAEENHVYPLDARRTETRIDTVPPKRVRQV
jgi:hypothetical protein